MFSKNSFSVVIEQDGTFRQGLNFVGGDRLDCCLRPMNHEHGLFACLAMLRAQISDDPNRCDSASVIQGEVNGQLSEEIIEAYPLAYASARGLEQHVELGDVLE